MGLRPAQVNLARVALDTWRRKPCTVCVLSHSYYSAANGGGYLSRALAQGLKVYRRVRGVVCPWGNAGDTATVHGPMSYRSRTAMRTSQTHVTEASANAEKSAVCAGLKITFNATNTGDYANAWMTAAQRSALYKAAGETAPFAAATNWKTGILYAVGDYNGDAQAALCGENGTGYGGVTLDDAGDFGAVVDGTAWVTNFAGGTPPTTIRAERSYARPASNNPGVRLSKSGVLANWNNKIGVLLASKISCDADGVLLAFLAASGRALNALASGANLINDQALTEFMKLAEMNATAGVPDVFFLDLFQNRLDTEYAFTVAQHKSQIDGIWGRIQALYALAGAGNNTPRLVLVTPLDTHAKSARVGASAIDGYDNNLNAAPRAKKAYEQFVQACHDYVADELAAGRTNVAVLDVYGGIDPTGILDTDGIHPTDAGADTYVSRAFNAITDAAISSPSRSTRPIFMME